MTQTSFTITTTGTQAATDLATALQEISSGGTDAATNTTYTITVTNPIYTVNDTLTLETGSSVIFESAGPFLQVNAFSVAGNITTDLNFTGTIVLDGGALDNVAITINSGTTIAGLYTGSVLGTLGDGGDSAINAGRIQNTGSYAAVEFDTGTVQNGWAGPASALISGLAGGVALETSGLVQNGGTILSTGTSTVGVFLGTGTVDNGQIGDTSATISGGATGVEITGVGAVVNDGTITGITSNAVYVGSGSVANGQIGAVTALISGGSIGVWIGTGSGTISNYGTITGSGTDGAFLEDGGTITNGASIDTTALISGLFDGVVFQTLGTLLNDGTIDATGSAGTQSVNGAFFEAGGTVENLSSVASIDGLNWGVVVEGGSGSVNNLGTIEASATSGIGVDLTAGGTVVNGATAGAGATISGVFDGVHIAAGTIGAGAVVQNDGTIIGSVGVDFKSGTSAATGTLTNDGLIESTSGPTGFAVEFGTGAETLVLQSSGTFVGGVLGNNVSGSSTTLELASGTQGTLSAVGNDGGTVTDSAGNFAFSAIGTLHVDAGASWTVTAPGTLDTLNNAGAVTLAAGSANLTGTITNAGTLTNNGTLDVPGASLTGNGSVVNNGLLEAASGTLHLGGAVSGAGTLALGTGSTLRLDQGVAGGETIAFATGAPETLILGTPGGSFINTVGGFVAGDRIELGAGISITAASFISASMIRVITTTGTYVLDNVTTSGGVVPNLVVGTDGTTGDNYLQAGTTLLSVPAQTDVWIGTPGGNVATAGNWNDTTTGSNPAAAAPGTPDTAQFLSGGGSLTGTNTVSVLQFGSGGVWSLGSGAALTASSAITVGSGIVGIGAGAAIVGLGTVDIISGTGLASASVLVEGATASWHSAGSLLVGGTGVGNLSISGAGTVIAAGATIANTSTASGSSVNVTGTGSDWTVSGALLVGNAGAGSLNITAGGTVSATSLDAGVISSGSIEGTGQISLSGPGSDLAISGNAIIGDAGSANLSILDGATLSAANLTIGSQGSGSGSALVSDTGSVLHLTGTLNVGTPLGVGELTIGPSATIIASKVVLNGEIVDEGGLLDPNEIDFTPGNGFVGFGTVGGLTDLIVNTGTIEAAAGSKPTQKTLTVEGTVSGVGGLLQIDAGSTMVVTGPVRSGQTIAFGGTSAALVLGDAGGFAGTVTTFHVGDELIVSGTSVVAESFVNNVLTLFASGTTVLGTVTFAPGAVSGGYLSLDGSGGVTSVACFAAGTRIGTERGEVRVEDLTAGDLVRTVLGDALAPVVWVGHRTVDCARHPKPEAVWPVRVRAHAFGANVPVRDVYLSPDHAVYLNEVLIPVKHLVNGSSVAQVPTDTVTYYHVELPAHDVVLAENLPAESYLQTGDRANFANAGAVVRQFPDFSARAWDALGCAPLVVTGAVLERARATVTRCVTNLTPPSSGRATA